MAEGAGVLTEYPHHPGPYISLNDRPDMAGFFYRAEVKPEAEILVCKETVLARIDMEIKIL